MNPGAIGALVSALEFAVGNRSVPPGTWDDEFARGVRLCVLETVLSTLGEHYPSDDAAHQAWRLSSLDPRSFSTFRRPFKADFHAAWGPASFPVNLETAAAALDAFLGGFGNRGKRSNKGVVFTPPALAAFLANELFSSDRDWSAVRDHRIIDPACGSGSLLLAAVNEGRKKIKADLQAATQNVLAEWAINHVRGVDRDQEAAVAAACLLGLSLGLDAEDVFRSEIVRVGDSLLEADEIISQGSYDRVIMNPPWVKVKHLEDPHYLEHLRATNRYPLTVRGGPGDLDLYQFFLERAFDLAADGAYIGFIVPGSFLRASRAARLRHLYLTAGHLVRLDEFWNNARIFPIHSMFRFVTATFKKGEPPQPIRARFRMGSVAEVHEQNPKQLPPSLFVDTDRDTARAIPEVVTCSALALYRRISETHPALGSLTNQWSGRFRFKRELDMTGDRHRFIECSTMDRVSIAERPLRPVYEGRMVHQFDAAAKTYCGGTGRSAQWEVWLPGQEFQSQFYVDDYDLPDGLIGQVNAPRAGFCDITGHANERTILAAMIPSGTVCGNKVPTLQADDPRLHLLWVAIANSFVVDWFLRRSVTTTINYHYLLGVPFPWIDPDSTLGRNLRELSSALAIPRSPNAGDLWQRARMRAEIDCRIAASFGLSRSEFCKVLDDFPLLDRAQPTPYAGPSTITRDLVTAMYSRTMGEFDTTAEGRVELASSVGAIPYVPSELATQLAAQSCDATARHAHV